MSLAGDTQEEWGSHITIGEEYLFEAMPRDVESSVLPKPIPCVFVECHPDEVGDVFGATVEVRDFVWEVVFDVAEDYSSEGGEYMQLFATAYARLVVRFGERVSTGFQSRMVSEINEALQQEGLFDRPQ